MSEEKITWSERWKNIKQVWGFTERPPTVETIPDADGMLPTASGNDDGLGWKRVGGSTALDENGEEFEYGGSWERSVVVGGCPGSGWNEGSPGVWHRSE